MVERMAAACIGESSESTGLAGESSEEFLRCWPGGGGGSSWGLGLCGDGGREMAVGSGGRGTRRGLRVGFASLGTLSALSDIARGGGGGEGRGALCEERSCGRVVESWRTRLAAMRERRIRQCFSRSCWARDDDACVWRVRGGARRGKADGGRKRPIGGLTDYRGFGDEVLSVKEMCLTGMKERRGMKCESRNEEGWSERARWERRVLVRLSGAKSSRRDARNAVVCDCVGAPAGACVLVCEGREGGQGAREANAIG